MPTAAAAVSSADLDPLLRHFHVSSPPSKKLWRLSSDSDWPTARKHSYFASYIPRSLYTAHEPSRLFRSSSYPVNRKRRGREVTEYAVVEGSGCGGAIEGLNGQEELISDGRDGDVENGCGDCVGSWMGELGGDRNQMDDLCDRKELISGERDDNDVENGGEDCHELEGGELVGDWIHMGELFDPEELISGRNNDDDAEDGGGLERGELASDQMDELSVRKGLVGGRSNGHVENEGGDGMILEIGVSVSDQKDELSEREELISGKCSDDEENGKGELVSDQIDDLCDWKELITGKNADDRESGGEDCGGLEWEELIGDLIDDLSDREDLICGKCSGDKENGGEDGGGLERREWVCDQIYELCDGKELIGGISSGDDKENENGDLGGTERGKLGSDQINVLCDWKELSTGKRGEDLGGLERGALVKDRIDDLCVQEELISGMIGDSTENGVCDCECDGLSIKMDALNRLELHDGSEDFLLNGSGSQSSFLGNLKSDLDFVKLNLFHEVERRREAEDSLVHMQNQWKRIASYFTLSGLMFPPITEGPSLQLDDNSLMQVCQEIVVAKFVSEAIERGLSRAESEASKELLIRSKDSEIAQLHVKLNYYESINHEMTQINQEVAEISHKRRRKRKMRQKVIWTCVGFSITIGVSLISHSFLLPRATIGVLQSSLPSK